MARMKHEQRKALAARKRAYRETQPDEPPVMELSERVALQAKAAAGPPENKAMPGPQENKAADLDSLNKAELYDLAQERDIEGRSDMTKAELLKALKG